MGLDVKVGDVVRVKSLKSLHRREGERRLLGEFTFDAPKGRDIVLLVLGSVAHTETPNAVEMMQTLGWEPPSDLIGWQKVEL